MCLVFDYTAKIDVLDRIKTTRKLLGFWGEVRRWGRILPRVSRPRDALGFWVEPDGKPSRSSKRSKGLGGMIFLRVSLPSDALSGIESI